MSDQGRTVLYYTFGNHGHWVDMEWLWGYEVMPGSVTDMVHFCEETGAKGNLNFDCVGYEKFAAESPETIAVLRKALDEGMIEIAGASYGQPYGLFHAGESNIRQRVYGVRTAMRVLGTRPRTFWEEEFDFFPQLPQILSGVGYKYASLFFQWTWHTPEVPYEDSPAVWWESPDGSRLLCATRNKLNVHQWPEDVDIVLNDLRNAPAPPSANALPPLMLQWLELMPTKDWMCRSEVLLPKTLELLADPRFEFRFATLSEYLEMTRNADLPVRRYGMDDVFHGMSLGKNGDLFRRFSRHAESMVLAAESLSATLGLFGRPYPQWDVYPTWELEESWRELLQAQHHDNDECEGLCGHVGKFSYERSMSLSGHVLDAAMSLLARRAGGDLVVYNPLSWERSAVITHPESGEIVTVTVPAVGYVSVSNSDLRQQESRWQLTQAGAVGRIDDTVVTVSSEGQIAQIANPAWPEGVLGAGAPLLDIAVTEGGSKVGYEFESMEIDALTHDLVIRFRHPSRGGIRADLRLAEGVPGLEVSLAGGSIPRPDPGMHTGMTMPFALNGEGLRIVADQPLGMQEIRANGTYRKKYPTGDWMTSPQWFEEIHNPFTGNSFVDLLDGSGERGLLVLHEHTRQWFREGDQVRCLLSMYDPWDEEYFVDRFAATFRLVPHGAITNSERYRLSQELACPCVVATSESKCASPSIPPTFSALDVSPSNVVVLAFYREMECAGKDFEQYAGHGIAYPYILRVMEIDGVATQATISVTGTVATAIRTNLLGEPEGELSLDGRALTLALRPNEIATVYVDLVEGRKQVRDLDAHRNVWATVHREGGRGDE